MRCSILILFILFFNFLNAFEFKKEYRENEAVVLYKRGTFLAPRISFIQVRKVYTSNIYGNIAIVKSTLSTKKLLNELKSDPNVLIAEPNYIYKIFSTKTNDPFLNKEWWLGDNGIDAFNGWDILNRSEGVIAIIDSGIDISHLDLRDNLWVNIAELNGEAGVDDDLNGYIDDIYGFNFVNNNSFINDEMGHGTHIAGIIGAIGNNNRGISGINWKSHMMILKAFGKKDGLLSDIIEAFEYLLRAKLEGIDIKVVNLSFGGGGYSQILYNLIEACKKENIVIVAAAGNEAVNNDLIPTFPASYDLDNIISVASFNKKREISSFSNYGLSVDIGAFGEEIFSTLPGGYGTLSGTSMAAPMVSASYALIATKYPQNSYLENIQYLLSSAPKAKEVANSIFSLNKALGNNTLRPYIKSKNIYGVYPKEILEIKGDNFGDEEGEVYIKRDTKITKASIVKWSDSDIRFKVDFNLGKSLKVKGVNGESINWLLLSGWEKVNNPFSFKFPAAVGDGNSLYIFQGEGSNFLKFDVKKGVWSKAANLIVDNLLMPSMIKNGNFIYLLGGVSIDKDGLNIENRCYRYDVSKDRWEEIASMPFGVYGGVSFVIDNNIFYIGGKSSSGYSKEILKYSIKDDSWEIVNNLDRGIFLAGGGVINNKIYLFGGLIEIDGNRRYSKKILVYDPKLNSWIEIEKKLPFYSTFRAYAQNDDYILLLTNKRYFRSLYKTDFYRGVVLIKKDTFLIEDLSDTIFAPNLAAYYSALAFCKDSFFLIGGGKESLSKRFEFLSFAPKGQNIYKVVFGNGTTIYLNALKRDNKKIEYKIVKYPIYGRLEINGSKVVYYTNKKDEFSDSFEYVAKMGNFVSNRAKVTLKIYNRDLNVSISKFNLKEDQNITINLKNLFGNIKEAILISKPSNGDAKILNYILRYIPNRDFFGRDGLFLKLLYNKKEEIRYIEFNIDSVNDIPVAKDDLFRLKDNKEIELDILKNDFDIETTRENLLIIVPILPQHGSLSIVNNKVIYLANKNMQKDNFYYYLKDSNGAISNLAKVEIKRDLIKESREIDLNRSAKNGGGGGCVFNPHQKRVDFTTLLMLFYTLLYIFKSLKKWNF